MAVQIGQEWIYRLRDDAQSERVRIVEVQRKKNSIRADIEFVDDDDRAENVPGTRLRGLWVEVAAYDELMANWDRIYFELEEIESDAVHEVFDQLVDAKIATVEWSPIRYATAIHDRAGLAALLDTDIDDLLSDIETFEHDGALMVSPEGTLRFAELACALHPSEVLAVVMVEESELRQAALRGRPTTTLDGDPTTTSPEWEYEWYLKSAKPRHELLRQWCGYRAVTMHERLAAAEAEVRRLDLLVTDLVDEVRVRGNKYAAEIFDERHRRERITPERVRPVVDRPLRPDEIPVREAPRRRRWG